MRKYENVLIGSDLDGTLYENQNNIPRENLLAIEQFVANGGKFAIATGRGIEAAREIAGFLPSDTPAIVNNGHTLYDYKKDEIIWTRSLPNDIKPLLSRILRENGSTAAEIYSGRSLYVINPNQTLIDHLKYEKVGYINACISDVYALEWNKVLLTDEKKRIDRVRERISGERFDGFEFVNTSELYLEAVISGVTKGTALLKLAEYYNIPFENTFSIGNYYNDIGLLESACHSAAVSGTPPEVARYADYICRNTAEQGAVAEYIRLIEQRF